MNLEVFKKGNCLSKLPVSFKIIFTCLIFLSLFFQRQCTMTFIKMCINDNWYNFTNFFYMSDNMLDFMRILQNDYVNPESKVAYHIHCSDEEMAAPIFGVLLSLIATATWDLGQSQDCPRPVLYYWFFLLPLVQWGPPIQWSDFGWRSCWIAFFMCATER